METEDDCTEEYSVDDFQSSLSTVPCSTPAVTGRRRENSTIASFSCATNSKNLFSEDSSINSSSLLNRSKRVSLNVSRKNLPRIEFLSDFEDEDDEDERKNESLFFSDESEASDMEVEDGEEITDADSSQIIEDFILEMEAEVSQRENRGCLTPRSNPANSSDASESSDTPSRRSFRGTDFETQELKNIFRDENIDLRKEADFGLKELVEDDDEDQNENKIYSPKQLYQPGTPITDYVSKVDSSSTSQKSTASTATNARTKSLHEMPVDMYRNLVAKSRLWTSTGKKIIQLPDEYCPTTAVSEDMQSEIQRVKQLCIARARKRRLEMMSKMPTASKRTSDDENDHAHSAKKARIQKKPPTQAEPDTPPKKSKKKPQDKKEVEEADPKPVARRGRKRPSLELQEPKNTQESDAVPKKRGRKPKSKPAEEEIVAESVNETKSEEPVADAVADDVPETKKQGRKTKKESATQKDEETTEPKKRGRKPKVQDSTKVVEKTVAPKKPRAARTEKYQEDELGVLAGFVEDKAEIRFNRAIVGALENNNKKITKAQRAKHTKNSQQARKDAQEDKDIGQVLDYVDRIDDLESLIDQPEENKPTKAKKPTKRGAKDASETINQTQTRRSSRMK